MKKIIIILGVCGLVAGCVSSEADLAKSGDWYEIGYSDGIKGRTQRSYQMLSDLGQVQLSDYDEGYLAGVDLYCDPDHAFQIGVSGTYYEGVCEGREDAQKFRMEWQRGWSHGKGTQ
ncbi:DUF2799 domain-containing protein [Vibrio tapetis]|uniref:Lipoprotein n=1 Tax=Vibrio tapetis subsp. tapetis TaxID=1671868 RepID=A0A2N8ZF25_9VIBR|nr:DUF2799 domain-containing protein [Vibrio tapetis]SON50527.1 conserved exported protein of unknown function [Vibrio tapetis subsp. tapetis]